MGYSLLQISEILLKADKTMYRLGTVAYENMFSEDNEDIDFERDIIYIYKKAVEYADDFYVGTLKLDQVVERLANKLTIYNYGSLNPIYSDVSILNPVLPTGYVLNDLADVTITNLQDNQILKYSAALGQWVNTGSNAAIRSTQSFTATLNQTVFTTTSPFTAPLLDVYLNGVRLNSASYSTFGNYTITLLDGCLADDIIDVTIYDPQTDILDMIGYVKTTRTLTINGVTYDLSADRTWTLPTGDMTKAVYDTDNDGIVDDAEKVTIIARNSTGSTIHKGKIVYLQGSTGNRPNMILAQANAEATSSGTFGVVVADVTNNADGEVAALGTLHDLDTRSNATNPFTTDTLVDGDTLWLSPTNAGYVTKTKPTAPNHAVFIGIVARTTPSFGRIVYRIQNGYELYELHDVSTPSYIDKGVLYRDVATNLWKTDTIANVLGYTPVGNNIYNSDGTLTGNRVVTLDPNQLVFRSNPSVLQNYTYSLGVPTGLYGSTWPSLLVNEGVFIIDNTKTSSEPYNTRVWGRNQKTSSSGSFYVNQVYADLTVEGGASTGSILNQTFVTRRGSQLDTSTTPVYFMRGVFSQLQQGYTAAYGTSVSIATTTQQAFNSEIINLTGTVTNSYNYFARNQVGYNGSPFTTNITNLYGFYLDIYLYGSTSSVTNYYGLFLNTPSTGSGTITNRWGVYAPDASMRHYLNGNLLLGSTTDNGLAKLQVTGAIQQSSVLSSLLKTDGSGVLVAATLGTDYSVLPSQSGNTGKFLSTDGSALSWADVITSNIYTADGALTGNRVVTMGAFTLSFDGGIYIKHNAQSQLISTFYGAGTTGNNIWIGGGGLNSTTGGISYEYGSWNTSLGVNALLSNTTGYFNSAVGFESLKANTSGYFNVAIGNYALFSNISGNQNTAIGTSAARSTTTGNYNSVFGSVALFANTTGANNTALGFRAGYGTPPYTLANTTGTNNIFIGYQSVGVSATESNRTWIGNSSTTSTWLGGNLLLGTTTDSGYKLDVNGTARVSGNLAITSIVGNSIPMSSSAYFIDIQNTSGQVLLRMNNNASSIIMGDGGVAFGKPNTINGVPHWGMQLGYGAIYGGDNLTGMQYFAASDGGNVIRYMVGHGSKGLKIEIQPTATIDDSALLQVNSTNKGFLPPRMTTTQRDAIASPATGLVIYNTTTLAPNVYNGTSWGAMGGDNIYTADGTLTGNRIVTNNAYTLTIKNASNTSAPLILQNTQAYGAGGVYTQYTQQWLKSNGTNAGYVLGDIGRLVMANMVQAPELSVGSVAGIIDAGTSRGGSIGINGAPIDFGTATYAGGGTNIGRWFATGNLLIQTGGTFTDSGYKLDVQGTARVSGDALVNGLTVGKGSSSSGLGNVAIGSGALGAASNSSYYNVAIGNGAMSSNTTGINSVAIGQSALSSNSTGSNAGANTVAIGFEALYTINNASGRDNVAIGYRAANNLGSGRYNVILGDRAASTIAGAASNATVVSNSVIIGSQAYPLADSQTNQIVIGYQSVGLGSNTTVIGNSSTTDTAIYGRMLVNYSSPVIGTYALDVNGTARVSGNLRQTNGNNYIDIISNANGSAPYIDFFYSGTQAGRLNSHIPSLGGNFVSSNGWIFGDTSSAPLSQKVLGLLATSVIEGKSSIYLSGTGENRIQFFQPSVAYRGNIGVASGTSYIQVRTGQATNLTDGTLAAVFFESGNVSIGTSTTDAGYKLDVNGTARVQGDIRTQNGTTYTDLKANATSGLFLNALIPATYDLKMFMNRSSEHNVGLEVGVVLGGIDQGPYVTATNNLSIRNLWSTGVNTRDITIATYGGTSSDNKFLTFQSADSSSNSDSAIRFRVAGWGNSAIMGVSTRTGRSFKDFEFRIGPTAADLNTGTLAYRINGDTGNFILGSVGTDVASAILNVDSTTKGFLPPRMTTTQRTSISSPAVGLIVYQTDATEGTYEYTSGGWRIINAAGSGGGSGTVTTVSVASANGFAGTVANATTTPAITISTTVTGLLKGNGTAISAATAGTDYLTPADEDYSVTSQTSNYTETVTRGTKIIKCDTTSGGFTVTLPTAVGNKALLIIKKVAGSGALTIDGNLTETIDGGTTATINKVYESITLISDNTNWQIV